MVAWVAFAGSVGLSASEEVDEDFRVMGIFLFFFGLFGALGHWLISRSHCLGAQEATFLQSKPEQVLLELALAGCHGRLCG